MTSSDLKLKYLLNDGGQFFDHDALKFFGDTMARTVKVVDKWTDSAYPPVDALELYRRRPVKNGLQKSAYFTMKGKQLLSVKEA